MTNLISTARAGALLGPVRDVAQRIIVLMLVIPFAVLLSLGCLLTLIQARRANRVPHTPLPPNPGR